MNKILLSTATAFILSLTACSSHAPEKRVHRILTDRIQTLAVAESCTGGTIAARFTALPGASAYFKCGVVAYSLDTKQEILQISCDTIARYGAVSEQVVRQMAEGVRRASNSHYAVATTGIAGPTGGTPEYPVGSVWIAVSSPLRTTTRLIRAGGSRNAVIRKAGTAAIELLEKARETTLAENNKSHINLYVALGIKSRACLAEGDWDGAFKAAKRVIDEGGYAVGTKSDLTGGMNSLDKQNVMWGAGIQVADQAGGYAGFFTHMDNKEGAYAKSAPKLISKQLYNRISATDIRRDWWDPSDKESPYVSKKFSFANVASFLGDYIYMRVEEMYFTAAEAALRLDDLKSARELMNTVMAERDPGYSANNRSGTLLGATTTTWTGSFLENILTHRRI